MSGTTTLDAKPDGHGHVIDIGGQAVKFDSVWDVYGDEPKALVVWTHDLTDVEVTAAARAYLEGPFARMTYAPHEHFGVTPDEYVAMSDRDLFPNVRRVWACWRAATADEKRALDWDGDGYLWEEWPEPTDGLQPACVIDIDE